jgi:hypothetical protein
LVNPLGQAPGGTLGTTSLVSDLQNAANFGTGGVVACRVEFRPFVTTVEAGSLVDETGRLVVDVFFGSLTATTLSTAEANELAAFVRAGGTLYSSGNSSDNEGPSYNPLFAALGVADRYADGTTGENSVQSSDPPDTTPFTNGPFGTIGGLLHSIFRPITTSSMTALATGFNSTSTLLAEGAFGAGRLSATGDPLHIDLFAVDADNRAYFLNLFAHACPLGN